MICPTCSSDLSYVIRTRNGFLEDTQIRLRRRVCKRCGLIYTSYEMTFDDKADVKRITKVVDSALSLYPPIISKRRQKADLFSALPLHLQ